MIYVTESRESSEGNTGFCLKKKFLAGTSMRTMGLCHSVQHTSKQLAGYLEVPYEELQWSCAGINHNAWFTQLHYQEQDMYPVCANERAYRRSMNVTLSVSKLSLLRR